MQLPPYVLVVTWFCAVNCIQQLAESSGTVLAAGVQQAQPPCLMLLLAAACVGDDMLGMLKSANNSYRQTTTNAWHMLHCMMPAALCTELLH
jgi:hypothetical protein